MDKWATHKVGDTQWLEALSVTASRTNVGEPYVSMELTLRKPDGGVQVFALPLTVGQAGMLGRMLIDSLAGLASTGGAR